MVAKSGEKARKTGDFRGDKFHEQVHVSQRETIPRCPNCGNDTFDVRHHEPGNKQS